MIISNTIVRAVLYFTLKYLNKEYLSNNKNLFIFLFLWLKTFYGYICI